jgi:hypothetical protein
MINVRLFKFLNVHGESCYVYRDARLPAMPVRKQTLYVGPASDNGDFDEDQVEDRVDSVTMRTGDGLVYVHTLAHLWGEENDKDCDGPTDLAHWLKYYARYGWTRCRDPFPWAPGFSEAWLLAVPPPEEAAVV